MLFKFKKNQNRIKIKKKIWGQNKSAAGSSFLKNLFNKYFNSDKAVGGAQP